MAVSSPAIQPVTAACPVVAGGRTTVPAASSQIRTSAPARSPGTTRAMPRWAVPSAEVQVTVAGTVAVPAPTGTFSATRAVTGCRDAASARAARAWSWSTARPTARAAGRPATASSSASADSHH